jgi:uncharacterized repeat protein (TIGR01451 family)
MRTRKIRPTIAFSLLLALAGVVVPATTSTVASATPACPPLDGGSWVGMYTGDSTGTYTADLGFGEGVSGTIDVPNAGVSDAPVNGSIDCNQIAFGDIGGAITFTGTIAADGATMSGTWQSGFLSGTYESWFELSGLDMAGYCASLGYDGVTLVKGDVAGPNFAFDNWACVSGESDTLVSVHGPAPSMDDACIAQNPGATPYAHANDPDDAYTWNCFPVSLVTSLSSTTNPVSAGQAVEYDAVVQNNGLEPVTAVHVIDTPPSGTSPVSAAAPDGCTGSAPVDCTLGTLAASASATAVIVVQTSTVGVITDTATATPGSNNEASVDTDVVASDPNSTTGFVPPNGSIGTGGTNPATLTLPSRGPGATVTLTQGTGDFCGGPCVGPATGVNSFDGYTDPNFPISLTLAYTEPNLARALHDYATSTVYKQAGDQAGVKILDCANDPTWTTAQKRAAALRRLLRLGTHSGIANPSPCIDARSIIALPHRQWQVTFTILYLSGDPHFARR